MDEDLREPDEPDEPDESDASGASDDLADADADADGVSPNRTRRAAALRSAAVEAAAHSDGLLSRAELRELGVDRNRVAREVAAGRWRLHGRRSIAVHTGALTPVARGWRAVHESGGDAVVDGVTSLQVAGVRGLDDEVVHVSLHHLCQTRAIDGVVQHKVARRVMGEGALPGLPRTPPALAALRAAQWAVSDRQAALFLVLPVQQRLITGEHLVAALAEYPGRRRRAVVRQLVGDITDGAHSLGELQIVPWCRARGLPSPSRQALRVVDGRVRYLDVFWDEVGLALEIDGAAHTEGLEVAHDHLRQNSLTMDEHLVLRMSLIGMRVVREEFLDQVVSAHRMLSATCRKSV